MKYAAEESVVRVLGRTLVREGIRYMNYSCSGIEFTFTGTKAEAVLCSNSLDFDEEHKAWVAVFIDDEEIPSKRFCVDKEEGTYLLYKGKAKHTKVRLVKYSEVAYGMVGIKYIITDGNHPPMRTKASTRRLEFIGDSITCGYGNEGSSEDEIFTTAQENPWLAYAARTARELEADYHLICKSGIGLISSWTETDEPNTEWLIPDLYPYTDKATDKTLGNNGTEVWDKRHFTPDCIIINIGTNDRSYTKKIPDRVKFFGDKYYQFVKFVKTYNPDARILCTLGVMDQELCGVIEEQVIKLNQEGHEDVYYMTFELQQEADGIGTNDHPSLLTHKKMAEQLVAKLKEILHW